ncbi:MAG: DegT/DnrJ/EryC1/StrS family aminotransferase [Planctomycetes bacterium]|nr:DegT/DnrJ/EryC1/StrS family aminotransferase [Planctomycetota bacterium]
MKVPFVDLTAQYESIKSEIAAKITDIISRGDFILGKDLEQFESEFAAYSGVKYGIGVASGTDALYLALLACDIGKGDEVITAANTFIATAIAISQTGAKPVLADIDRKTYNLDPKHLFKLITKNTKAIIPVHLCGQPAQVAEIKEIAAKHKLRVIEDAAQAHGAYFDGKNKVGSLSDLACFSFYPAKNLGAYGDGGMIITNSPELAEKARLLRNYGQKIKNEHSVMGFNSRLDNLHAAVLRIKLKYLDEWNDKRRRNGKIYYELFGASSPVVLPNPEKGDHIYHLYVVLAENRNKLADFLKKREIASGMHYPIPVHLQPCYKHLGYHKGDCPNAEYYAENTLSLPMYPELSLEQIKWVVDSVKEFYG